MVDRPGKEIADRWIWALMGLEALRLLAEILSTMAGGSGLL